MDADRSKKTLKKRRNGNGNAGRRRGGLLSLIAWLPLLAGGVAAAWFVARRSADSSESSTDNGSSPAKCPPSPRSISRLRAAIIGNDKAAVAAVFGPPRASAGFSSLAPTMLVWSDYLHADTWYYPLDTAARAALMVQFDNGIAQDAQLVLTPEKQR